MEGYRIKASLFYIVQLEHGDTAYPSSFYIVIELWGVGGFDWILTWGQNWEDCGH